jgi:hypothetical protein
VQTIERRATGANAIGLCFRAACKLSWWNQAWEKMRALSQAPKTARVSIVLFFLSLERLCRNAIGALRQFQGERLIIDFSVVVFRSW